MTRSFALAAIAAAGFAIPAHAAETPHASGAEVSVHAAELADAATAKQAQLVLAQKGYVNVAITGRDDDGRWTGTAFKDGKTVLVAVELPTAAPVATN